MQLHTYVVSAFGHTAGTVRTAEYLKCHKYEISKSRRFLNMSFSLSDQNLYFEMTSFLELVTQRWS